MNKLDLKTKNFINENLEKIAAIFPSCIVEAEIDGVKNNLIDFDVLKQELSSSIIEGPQERYQINWPGKRTALLTANSPTSKTLRPKRSLSKNFDSTKNLLIEGDNLDVLRILQESYLGKIKLIYIDPPYNTGNDFIYEDAFAENAEEFLKRSNQKDAEGNRLVANTNSNGRFHSDWLSMMYSRLKLSSNLLSDDGVIFISIDENEIHNLRKICDEIFGEANHIATFIWEKKYTTSNNIQGISSVHEYILGYVKNNNFLDRAVLRLDYTNEARARYKNPDNDPRGDWMDVSYHGPKKPSERPNLSYAIKHPKTGLDIIPLEKSWAYEKSSHLKHVEENRLWWGNDYSYKEPRLKKFISEMEGGMIPKSLLKNQDVGGTSVGRNDLRELFEDVSGSVFDNPKPVSLMLHLLKIATHKDSLVLDFFAGSGSTAHAVMKLNSQDGGCRKYISVQLDEKCDENSEAFKAGYSKISDITRERICRAGKQISSASLQGLQDVDIGFRYFDLDTSNMLDVYYSPDTLEQSLLSSQVDNVKSDRTYEDLLFQVLINWGVDLSLPISVELINGKEVLSVDQSALIACFDGEGGVDEELVKVLAGRLPLRVIFRDSGFKDDAMRINVEQLFKSISPSTEIKTI
jgi:adenine-specific DNA-methyltransferase